jgi:uncharacterized protein (DUF305 family)
MSILSQLTRTSIVALSAALILVATGEAQEPATPVSARYTAADVRFMQDMIIHHAQAVEMTALVAARTERADVRRLAARIEVSQEDELEFMRRWLEARDQAVPDAHGHHGGHGGHGHDDAEHRLMPGMVGAEDMARLRAATGSEFDGLFLELMIRHHEGALVMVEELMATDGAGQESEIFQFASHVDSDQRIEIARMRMMLEQGG